MKENKPQISIIIPVLNEEKSISGTLRYLIEHSTSSNIAEVLIVDGGSTDGTLSIAQKYDVQVIKAPKGRARQMNLGAHLAQSEVLYFLHVDTLPPKDFDQSILNAFKTGSEAGCFRMKFNSSSRFLAFFAWFTKLNFKVCRGGDQSLFITKNLFQRTGGFNEAYKIYEDNEFTNRLYKFIDFKILPRPIITSARRYEERGQVLLQYHFGVIHLKNYFGAGPEELYKYYRQKIAL